MVRSIDATVLRPGRHRSPPSPMSPSDLARLTDLYRQSARKYADRVALAGLCRTELRAKRWHRARSLARLEAEIAPLAPDVRLEPDMFIRTATAEWHLASYTAAQRWIRLAREAAQHVVDPAIRAKLLADVDAAEGVFLRRIDPQRAVALLSAAVAFQNGALRPIVLPELYLARGGAYVAADDPGRAEADFDVGLSELERQRSHMSDAELRPGIFDDATELFDDAIALQIRRGTSADVILRYVERGRARSVLEQINAREDDYAPPVIPTIADIQRELSPGTALLEYVSLPDRLVVFFIARDRAVMRVVPVPRAALARAAQAFTDSKGVEGRTLYSMLIAPLSHDLRGVFSLNVVADDILQRVPFAALFDEPAQTFLIQRSCDRRFTERERLPGDGETSPPSSASPAP